MMYLAIDELCRFAGGDTWTAFVDAEGARYTTTSGKNPNSDGCYSSTGSHSFGNTMVEKSCSMGGRGYYFQWAFIDQVGCVEIS